MSQTKETGRAARQGPPPPGAAHFLSGRKGPFHTQSNIPATLTSLLGHLGPICLHDPQSSRFRRFGAPVPPLLNLDLSARHSEKPRPPAGRPSGRCGKAGSGQAPLLPRSRDVGTWIPRGARSPRRILGCLFGPLGTVPAGTEQLGGEGAAAAAGDRRRVRALSEARAAPRPARRARQHRARTRVPGRRQPPEGVRPEREGMGSWSAHQAPSTNARSGPGSAQTAAPGAATGAER